MVAPTLTFAESYAAEDLVLQTARSLADEVGLECVTAGAGAVLRLLAAAGAARAVVEIGTGTGVSGVWLLRGMRPDGVLTTIDREAEHQRIARRIFQEAGFAPGRTRIITGRALDVLPRLTDGGYDLVFVDADRAEFAACVQAALRLLRPGGVVAVNHALPARIGDPAARDPDTVAVRELLKEVREAEDSWVSALVPAGAGLLAAVRR
jgi:predicted O-methyltransferase YrrM